MGLNPHQRQREEQLTASLAGKAMDSERYQQKLSTYKDRYDPDAEFPQTWNSFSDADLISFKNWLLALPFDGLSGTYRDIATAFLAE